MGNLLNNELKVKLDCFKKLTQMELFQNMDESIDALSEDQMTFIEHYALISGNVRGLFPHANLTGRPLASRESILKLFFMKAFLNLPTTNFARDLVLCAYSWRRICGFEFTGEVPSESTRSRAFAEFSGNNAIVSIHSGLLKAYVKDTRTLLCNVSNDSTEIKAREQRAPKEKTASAGTSPALGRRRRSKAEKGNTPPSEPSNLERQSASSQEENMSRIPRKCDWGRKSNGKGKVEQWGGYKLHLGVADCGMEDAAMSSILFKLTETIRQNALDDFMKTLQSYFASIPYDIPSGDERFYQTIFFVTFLRLEIAIDAGARTNEGRIDAYIRTAKRVYLFGFKLDKTAEKVLGQIASHCYYEKFQSCGLPIIMVGVNFDSEKGRIDDWSSSTIH